MTEKETLGREIISKALECGASLAGIVNIEELKLSPSHTISGRMVAFTGVSTKDTMGKVKRDQVQWEERAKSAVVIAVEHPEDEPDMDYWVQGLSGGTRGNAKLISVFSKLADWLEKEKDISGMKIAYHVEKGGVFMKDAAVQAGLGCIGKNNLLLTPELGSRVRLRVMLLDADLPSTGIAAYDPCEDCEQFCKKACPQGAMGRTVYTAQEMGQDILPGRNGTYNRKQCNKQMEKDLDKGKDVPIPDTDKIGNEVRFCRRCELACPVGSAG